ncbi:glycosyl hydrolase, partial [Pontibacter sp. HJ8]
NKDRGVYKTTDGGKTWKKTLYIDDNTGAIDLQVDPKNPNNVFAAMWHRERRAWDFVESGKTSGIHKSTDGGNTWTDISTAAYNFPDTEGVGRIGLSMYPGDPNIMYALVDNFDPRPQDTKSQNKSALSKETLSAMSEDNFLKLKDEEINQYLDENQFPREYAAKNVKEMVKSGKIKPAALADYLNDPTNEPLPDVIGAEVYRTDNGGKSWKKTHSGYIDGLYSTIGYYLGVIRVSPTNPDKIYTLGVPLFTSDDAGKTFKTIGGANVHSDHQALWINPNKPEHLIEGNDGGLNISYDAGENWLKVNVPSVAQFYAIEVDMAKPYNVYGGLQDNGTWYGPSNYAYSNAWTGTGLYPYQRLGGGDGMMVQVDWRDNNTVYYGSQFGNYTRVNKQTGERTPIKPSHKLGETPLRFNWESPIHLSRHNQDILYFGSNKFHRSLKKGDEMEALSGDLTNGGQKGNVSYGTLTCINESPLRFGLLYTGSDDGAIHVSRDGGYNWENISKKLPQNMWVSTVVASNHKENRVYTSLNGYRWDDFTPYLYVSEDNGKKWERLGSGLPQEAINVMKEDPKNPDLLYVGTDHGLYISLDRGKSFMQMRNGMPAVAVHDLTVHPRDNDLVVGTHGRGIYIANVEHLQQLTPALLTEKLHLFAFEPVQYNPAWGQERNSWRGGSKAEISIPFYSAEPSNTIVRIKTAKGVVVKEMQEKSGRGLNYITYNLSVDEASVKAYEAELTSSKEGSVGTVKVEPAENKVVYLRPGKYTVEVQNGTGAVQSQELSIKAPQVRTRG